MNREFDIDNILAEIKIKKDEERPARREAQSGANPGPRGGQHPAQDQRFSQGQQSQRSSQGQRAPQAPQGQRSAQRPQRAAPAALEDYVREPAPAEHSTGRAKGGFYEEYAPLRPPSKQKRYEEETQYEPASAIFALAHEQEERAEKRRAAQPKQGQAAQTGREREYREELPSFAAGTQPQARRKRGEEPDDAGGYQERYAPQQQRGYERDEQPRFTAARGGENRPEKTTRRETEYDEQPRFTAARGGENRPEKTTRRETEYDNEYGESAKKTTPTRGARFDEREDTRSPEEIRMEYDAEYVGREAFEEPTPKKTRGFGRHKDDDAEDDFIAKFSQVTPLGARKTPRIDRDHVRGHFGEAESIAPQMPRPKPYQRAAEPEAEPYERSLPKPELKGGFRMEPGPGYRADDATRLDLPLAGADDGAYDNAEFDDTRSLAPFDYAMEDELPPEDDEPYYDDLPASALPLEEFEAQEDAGAVREDFATLRRGLMLRFAVTFLCFLALLYLGLCQAVALPAPEFLSPSSAPGTFAAVSVGLLAAAAIACHSAISGGITSLFTLKANNDSLAALATLACVMQGVAVLLSPSALGSVQLYAAVAAAGLLFGTVGRLFTLGRVSGNFRIVSSGAQKYAVQALQERELGRELTWDMNIEEAHVAYSTQTEFLEGFIGQSYAGDATGGIARIASPILFLASIAVAVFTYVIGSDIFMTLSVFAAVLSIASPFTAVIVGSLPLHKAYRSLSRCGAMLSGYNAVERFADTNVILADACELFTSEEVLLHNIKTFAKTRIDDAILDAASVLCMCNGAVKNIFLRIIQGNTKMLKYVENIVYEDAMGISAWVGGKRVLIGNSDLMKHHGIDTPSRDYEAKYRTEDRDILYLANSGELTAMFVISYVANRDVDEALVDLGRKGISVVVRSVDPNLTATKIARIYDLPEEMIRILPAKLHLEYETLCGADRERDEAYIAHGGTFLGFARAVSAAGAVRVATNIGLIVQTVGMVLGYALITFFSFMGAMDEAGLATVLVFQSIWSAAVWMFTGLRRI